MGSIAKRPWIPFRLLAGALAAVVLAATLAVVTTPAPARGTHTLSAEQPDVPDVVAQFDALALRPEGLTFDPTDVVDPTFCKHYQGMARKQGPDGTPYLFVTRSGVEPTTVCGFDDDPGNLQVVRMGSRDSNGERLRSNRLRLGLPGADPRDAVVTTITFSGGASWPAYGATTGWPDYGHPGGMQLIGDVLAVAMEEPYDGASGAAVMFLDVSHPETPRFLSVAELADEPTDDWGAGTIGVTPVGHGGGCCRYLMMVTGKANREIRFYLSNPTPDSGDLTDLTSEFLTWQEIDRWNSPRGYLNGIEVNLPTPCFGDAAWPSGTAGGHQTLNFVWSQSDFKLYLVGLRNDGLGGTGDDMMDLLRMELIDTPDGVRVGAPCPFYHVRSMRVSTHAYNGYPDVANFATAGGVYVSPSEELIVYSTDYHNTGPRVQRDDGTIIDRESSTFGEFRHRNMVRPGSPTLHPTASVDEPFAVDEGSSVQLTGVGAPPITKAWIQLFEDDGAGASVPGWEFADSDKWLAIDYLDRDAGFDDFAQHLYLGGDFAENAGSWRWFAPMGCAISANDYPVRSDEFPGPDTVMLAGNGEVVEATNLDALRVYKPSDESPWPVSPVPAGVTSSFDVNFDDDVEGVTFYHVDKDGVRVHTCESYYNAPISLGWDLDRDGTFEANGTSVPFSAAQLDGPSNALVDARAQHPTDPTDLGVGEPIAVPVEVLNVPPSIASSALRDSLGNAAGVGIGPVLLGLPTTLEVTFTDPGVADTQAATVDWGDGTVDSIFDSYADAHGGGVGSLKDAHTFAAPGVHDIVGTITDDDGGSAQVELSVEVLSPTEMIEGLADQLTALITSTSNPKQAAALRAARDELIGNHGGTPPTNGAFDKLEDEDPVSAVTKIRAAISYLIAAESSGATGGLSGLKDMLGLVAEAIATAEYHEAQAAVAPPSTGETRTLASISSLIVLGHQQLMADQHLSACNTFRQAVEKAVKLSA